MNRIQLKELLFEDTQRLMAEKDLLTFVKELDKSTEDDYALYGRLVHLSNTLSEECIDDYDPEEYLYYAYYKEYLDKIIDYIRKSL